MGKDAGKVVVPFTFETGNKSSSTHPGPHVLAGYLTLTEGDTGTGYVMAQESGATAFDFETLKIQTPVYQSYSLKKNQAQWIPVLALNPDTNYDIYVGVELENGSNYIEVVTAKTAKQLLGPWHIVHDEQTDPQDPESTLLVSRRITVYEGQEILLPSISDIDSSSSTWVETSDVYFPVFISSGDAVITNAAKSAGLEDVEILTDVGNTDQFYEAHFKDKVTLLAKTLNYFAVRRATSNPQAITYLVDVVQ